MRHLLISAIVAAGTQFALVVPVHSQATAAGIAGFQGTWTLDLGRSGGTSPERRIVSADAESMRIETHRAEDARPPVLLYRFDGSDKLNAFGDNTATTRLRREGSDLVLETVYLVNEQAVTVDETWRLDENGREMIVDVMMRIEHGYHGVPPPFVKSPPNISKVTNVFRKEPN
jgi:hypothetical protein